MTHRLISLLFIAALIGAGGCGNMTSYHLSSIAVTPKNPVFAKDQSAQLAVTATFSNGSTISSWSQVTWVSSDNAIATVNTAGLVTGKSAGTAVITAVDKAHPDITDSITAIITEQPLQSVALAPVFTGMIAGTVQQFTATGIYTATTWTMDLTPYAVWFSSHPAVALVSNTTGSNGMVTSVATGTAVIGAQDVFSGITGTTLVAVLPSTLDSISILSSASSMSAGTSQQLSAIYTGSTWTMDLTPLAVWSSSTPSVAQVSNTPGSKGLVTTSAAVTGTADISATDLTTGITGSTTLIVN